MSAVIEEKTIRGLREIAFLGFFTVALFFLIALITYSNEDAGWSHSGSMQSIANACGIFGAWIADFVLSIFGLMAYLFPTMIVWHGYLAYSQTKQQNGKFVLVLRWIGFIATVFSGSAIFYLHILRIRVELPGSTGGVLGQEVGDTLLIALGNSGATLLLLAIFLAGITLLTGLSWVALLDTVGKFTITMSNKFYQWILSCYDSFQDRRNVRSSLVTREVPIVSSKKSKLKILPTIGKMIPSEPAEREVKESQEAR